MSLHLVMNMLEVIFTTFQYCVTVIKPIFRQGRRDPRRCMVYVPDSELPVPTTPRHSLGFQDKDEAEDEINDFGDEED